jgi:hypothetical protein
MLAIAFSLFFLPFKYRLLRFQTIQEREGREIDKRRKWTGVLIGLHPMSWLAVTFTTQEINSLRQPAINSLFLVNLFPFLLPLVLPRVD